jgi:splicing factor 3A subunit 3
VLEHARGKQAELEALSIFSSQLLHHVGEPSLDASNFTPGLQEAWKTVSNVISQDSAAPSTLTLQQQLLPTQPKWEALPLGRTGQWKQTVHTQVLANGLKRTSTLAAEIQAQRLIDGGPVLEQAVQTARSVSDPSVWLQIFDQRLGDMQTYHARHDSHSQMQTSNGGYSSNSTGSILTKRPRVQVAATADGYDLSSSVHTWLQSVQDETLFSSEEVMGKYLDLQSLYTTAVTHMKDIFLTKDTTATTPHTKKSDPQQALLYSDFLQILSDGLPETLAETSKLQHRKKYVRFLMELQTYLHDFLRRTCPLLPILDVTAPAVTAFSQEWRETGGVEGWEAKPAEAALVPAVVENNNGDDDQDQQKPAAVQVESIDLSEYSNAEELVEAVDGDRLKTELARLGMKCGGTVSDRAKRLFLTKDTPLDQLPAKVFANKKTKETVHSSLLGGGGSGVAKNERRVDIARREAVVTALLSQLRPTLEATVRRTERRQTQTLFEREREVEEELYGSEIAEQSTKKQKTGEDGDSDDSDDEDDAPVYNPKNIPLDWDGKPMPYWLYKLHGLQHYYDCQICGGESYRGRRNFELHFADQKHALGMKSLGIPNTNHFHGVTKIDDAMELWKSLQVKLEDEQFDGTKEEEYEDSHGNVLSRTTYEDLARQGLL